MKKRLESIVVIIYTLINLKFLWPFIFDKGYALGAVLQGEEGTLLAISIGLFLNTALILYWLNKKEYGVKI